VTNAKVKQEIKVEDKAFNQDTDDELSTSKPKISGSPAMTSVAPEMMTEASFTSPVC